MRRVAIGLGALYVLFALIGRFVEAMGAARCPCEADCWCKKPVLSTFRWVAPFGHRVAAHGVDEDERAAVG